MCHRMSSLLFSELQQALWELKRSGRARIPRRDPGASIPDAYPGAQVPLIVPGADGSFEARALGWGFDAPAQSRSKLVFNTRLDTALAHARTGEGMWAEAIMRGRCLVPVRAFWENWSLAAASPRAQVRFIQPGLDVFLLAGIYRENRFSVVTTEPNAIVGSYHSRMPLVLAPGESRLWLGPNFAQLADRSGIALDARVEGAP